jgi:photosystem II stability/assembly factor-like uncharacterized protein
LSPTIGQRRRLIETFPRKELALIRSFAVLFALLQASPSSPWEPLKLPEAAAGRALRSVFAVDAQTAWIVGDKGLCLQTQDGGRTWKEVALGTQAHLRAVRFLDRQRGIIVGEGDPSSAKPEGHIVMGRLMLSGTGLWTSDGGKTWKKSALPTNFEIHSAVSTGGPIQFGISGGDMHLDGDIMRSSAAFGAWDGKGFKTYRCYRALFDIRAVDDKRWVAVGSPVSVGFIPPPTDPLYLQKACRALFSLDGGETWKPSKGSDGALSLRGLAVLKDSRVLAVGDEGALLVSEDAGATWKKMDTASTRDLRAIVAGPAVVAVGADGTALVSLDGSAPWKPVSAGGSDSFLSVTALGDRIIAVGENGLARSAAAKALLDSKPVDFAPKKIEPKKATKAQRDRIKVGDTATYQLDIKAPAMGMKHRCQRKLTVTAAGETDFTVDFEVIEGTLPPGLPRKGEDKMSYEDLTKYDGWKVGEARTEKSGANSSTTTRLPDEEIKIGDKSYKCTVIESKWTGSGGGMLLTTRSWLAQGSDLPLTGTVREEAITEAAAPQGKVTITNAMELVSYKRAGK